MEPVDERRDALVEAVAREIRLRGLTGPAVHFLEASRPYRPLGAPAMLFFDPVLGELFGGQTPSSVEHVIFALRGAAAYEAFAAALSAGEPAPVRPLVASTGAGDAADRPDAAPPPDPEGRGSPAEGAA